MVGPEEALIRRGRNGLEVPLPSTNPGYHNYHHRYYHAAIFTLHHMYFALLHYWALLLFFLLARPLKSQHKRSYTSATPFLRCAELKPTNATHDSILSRRALLLFDILAGNFKGANPDFLYGTCTTGSCVVPFSKGPVSFQIVSKIREDQEALASPRNTAKR